MLALIKSYIYTCSFNYTSVDLEFSLERVLVCASVETSSQNWSICLGARARVYPTFPPSSIALPPLFPSSASLSCATRLTDDAYTYWPRGIPFLFIQYAKMYRDLCAHFFFFFIIQVAEKQDQSTFTHTLIL